MQPEGRFKLKVQKRLREIPEIFFFKTQEVSVRGIPDVLICYRGMFYAWELKVNKNKATELQQHVLNNITKAGGIARVVTPDNLDECIEELLNG